MGSLTPKRGKAFLAKAKWGNFFSIGGKGTKAFLHALRGARKK